MIFFAQNISINFSSKLYYVRHRNRQSIKKNADGIHLDIMDGVFVPNISFGFPIIESIRKYTDAYLDAHLMIVEPDR